MPCSFVKMFLISHSFSNINGLLRLHVPCVFSDTLNLVPELLRVDWWGRKRRGCCTEGAQRRNWIQRGSGWSHPRYHHTQANICISGGVQGIHTQFLTLQNILWWLQRFFFWITVTCLDPGLSNCTTQTVLVNINGDDLENINPTQQLGEQTDSLRQNTVKVFSVRLWCKSLFEIWWACWIILISFVFLQVMEVSYEPCHIRNNPFLCWSKSLSKPWLTPFRICGCHPFASGWIPTENRRWGFITEWCQLVSDPSLQTKHTDSLVSRFSLSSKSFLRKKKSWWILRCTSLPWGWFRPFSSRESCPCWSSEENGKNMK